MCYIILTTLTICVLCLHTTIGQDIVTIEERRAYNIERYDLRYSTEGPAPGWGDVVKAFSAYNQSTGQFNKRLTSYWSANPYRSHVAVEDEFDNPPWHFQMSFYVTLSQPDDLETTKYALCYSDYPYRTLITEDSCEHSYPFQDEVITFYAYSVERFALVMRMKDDDSSSAGRRYQFRPSAWKPGPGWGDPVLTVLVDWYPTFSSTQRYTVIDVEGSSHIVFDPEGTVGARASDYGGAEMFSFYVSGVEIECGVPVRLCYTGDEWKMSKLSVDECGADWTQHTVLYAPVSNIEELMTDFPTCLLDVV